MAGTLTLAPSDPAFEADEMIWTNGVSAEPALTICVPAYRDSAAALIASLCRQGAARETALILHDDGSGDAAMTQAVKAALADYPGPAMLVSAPVNRGRSEARNRLIDRAQSDWLLFLDADMEAEDDRFLTRYLEAMSQAGPGLITGGFSVAGGKVAPEFELHAAQSRRSECLPARERMKAPGLHVFTSNMLVHRDVICEVRFDPAFTGWGWEDVDWGLRVAARFPVIHIDNPARHLGLDSDRALIAKYARSGANFARLCARHPEAAAQMRLYRLANRFRALPFKRGIGAFFNTTARTRWLPLKLRLLALKTFRAVTYAETLA